MKLLTPERLAEIRAVVRVWEHLNWDQVEDLFVHIDVQKAEIERLRNVLRRLAKQRRNARGSEYVWLDRTAMPTDESPVTFDELRRAAGETTGDAR